MLDHVEAGRKRPRKQPGFFKRIGRSGRAAAVLGALASSYIKLVFRTGKLITEPKDAEAKLLAAHPAILTVWHGQGFMAVPAKPEAMPAKVLVTRHGDGQIAGRIMTRLGVDLIQGAGSAQGGRKRVKDKGGAQALREMVRALSAGYSVIITADMPGAPAREAGMGVVTLARLSGRPIVPVALSASRYVALDTWSRFMINLPFSRLGFAVGDPIAVPRNADGGALEAVRLDVEKALNAATQKASDLSGARAPAPLQTAPHKPGPGRLLRLYTAFTRALRPAAPLLLRRRSRRGKEIESRLGERMGLPGAERPQGALWWFHAASVGETNAILPLIEKLKAARPRLNILLTTVTVTSARVAEARLPPGAIHQFVPLDAPSYVARFFDAWRPDAGLLTESEIWPNLIFEADRREIPLILLNARMSDRSYARWKKLQGVSRPLFSRFELILAQSARLAKRLEKLGARRVIAAGNIKFDAPAPPADRQQLARLQAQIGKRPVFFAASTHAGEDEIVLSAHMAAARKIPGLLTIIAPRHPERGEAVAALARQLGAEVLRRSEGGVISAAASVYIADSIGEMGLFYTLSPAAFIGGSLTPHGGQNPIEAVKLGAAVLTGPHVHNFKDAYRALEKCGGCRFVTDAPSLARAMIELYTYPPSADAMRERAELGISVLSGALDRTFEALEPFLPPLEPTLLPKPASYAT